MSAHYSMLHFSKREPAFLRESDSSSKRKRLRCQDTPSSINDYQKRKTIVTFFWCACH